MAFLNGKYAKYRNFVTLLLLAVAALLIVYGVWGYVQRYKATHNPKPVISAHVVARTTDQPDETPPKESCANHPVPASEPRAIEISSIGASGCIQKVGVDQHNAIAAPSNVHVAGWYVKSPAPGGQGVSIIDGHVRGRYADGIFSKLDRVRAGDVIKVQMGDNTWREFSVVRTGTHSVSQAGSALFEQLDGASRQLTLITCTGKYDVKTKTYNKRIVVQASLR